MSILDTIYDMNRERIRKGERVITYEDGTIFYPKKDKNERKKRNETIHRSRSKR